MSELVADCPRCGAKNMTFDLKDQLLAYCRYNWQHWFEAFCICRQCNKSTVFMLSQKSNSTSKSIKEGLAKLPCAVNQIMEVEYFIGLKDMATIQPPDYLPKNIEAIFREGAACKSIGCFNAAGTMFRLCIDLSTRSLLPDGEEEGLNARTRRNLGLRLPWLFDHGKLPESLRELSLCIKDDGNDGAHEGTLTKEDVEDMLDFTYVMLERIYTDPKRIELAKIRRENRHKETS